MVCLDKIFTERTRQNDKDHESLFDRVGVLEDQMGPALGFSHSLAEMVADGEARFQTQRGMADDNLFLRRTRPLIALIKRFLPKRNKFHKRLQKSL